MMINDFVDDLMFDNIEIYKLEITEEEVFRFKKQIFNDDLPNEYVIDLLEFTFKVNKIKKEFRILKRHYYDTEVYIGYPNKQQVDYTTFSAYKTAMKAGFQVFLENKYSN